MIQNGLKVLSGGNLAVSGISVGLLITALQTLHSYGIELSNLRDDIRKLQDREHSTSVQYDSRLISLETKQQRLLEDTMSLQRLAADPRPAPGAWTAQDGRAAVSEIKAWVHELLAEERVRRMGSGPISLHSLVEVQHAIAQIKTDDQSAWTRDGKPRVDAIKARLGRPLSEAERDRAWNLLQVMERVK